MASSLAAAASTRLLSTSPLAVKAADAFVNSWVSGVRITPDAYPQAPETVQAMYETHLAIQQHPLVADKLGGLAGYKLGAIGGAGEPCLYAPLFGNYLVDAPGDGLSAAAINLWQIEPEIALVMGDDLPARADGEPHSVEAVWACVSKVALCIECCGKRGLPEAYAATSKLGSYQDTLSSGGVVLGPRLDLLTVSDVRSCATKLYVNDDLLAEGKGASAPEGGPAEALTWLANHLNGRGLSLGRGELVATGQTCNTQACKAGDRVKATFEGLGGKEEMAVEMIIQP